MMGKLQLYKTIEVAWPPEEWTHLNVEQDNNTRQTKFKNNRTNRLKLGSHYMCNRYQLNDKILWTLLSLPFSNYELNF